MFLFTCTTVSSGKRHAEILTGELDQSDGRPLKSTYIVYSTKSPTGRLISQWVKQDNAQNCRAQFSYEDTVRRMRNIRCETVSCGQERISNLFCSHIK